MIKIFLIVFILVIAYRVIDSIYSLHRLKVIDEAYLKWLMNQDENNPPFELKKEFLNLMDKADISDHSIPYTQPAGYGYIRQSKAESFHNFPSNVQEFATHTVTSIKEAEGYFKLRMKSSFNPLYWINEILFLPKNLLLYLNFSEEKTLFKLVNVLITFIWWALIVVFSFYQKELKQIISSWLLK